MEQLDKVLKILKGRHNELRRHFDPEGTDCYRIFNRDFGNLPLLIDRYGSWVHLTLLENQEGMDLNEDEVKKIADALYCPLRKLVVKRRQILSDHEQYGTLAEEQDTQIVRENDLNFEVNLRDRIDTGLFLDHRPTREMVRAESFGRSVLNLFCYTGSFSLYAASGGASRITSVDLSATALEQAKRNFRLNDFLPGAFEFIQGDVFSFLKEAADKGEKWDLIILDPPTFSNSRKMDRTLKIQKDYVELIISCFRVLKGDGTLYFSNNQSDFRFNKKEFPSGIKINEITPQTTGEDFKGRPAHRCWELTGLLQGKTGNEAGRSTGRSRNRRPFRGGDSRSRR